MKINLIYSTTDFQCGQRFRKPGTSEIWMLGYDSSTGNLALISLSDGMISNIFNSREHLVIALHTSNLVPVELLDLADKWEITCGL